MKICVIGGAGYVGSVLVPALIEDGHEVVVFDAFYFGNYLPMHIKLTSIEGDVRDTPAVEAACAGADAVIHLACISNDPSFELDESLSRTINYECFEPTVIAAKRAGVKRFIFASTSSVYGISDAPDVREDHPLVPITLYNSYKAACEPLLLKHRSDGFEAVVLRPSTLCGYSPRQRLDLAVNILTNQAVNAGRIIVFGGEQKRPNLHINDMIRAYQLMLSAPAALIDGETFNVGAQNMSIMELAKLVQDVVEHATGSFAPIEIKDTIDTRSYQVNSDKIRDVLGFVPQRTVSDAVVDLCRAFRAGKLPNSLTDERYFNVQRMRKEWTEVYKDAPPTTFDPTAGVMSEIDLHRMKK